MNRLRRFLRIVAAWAFGNLLWSGVTLTLALGGSAIATAVAGILLNAFVHASVALTALLLLGIALLVLGLMGAIIQRLGLGTKQSGQLQQDIGTAMSYSPALITEGGVSRPAADPQEMIPDYDIRNVRITISQVNFKGLLTKSPANESISVVLDAYNLSGFPIRVSAIAGFILIGNERQEPPPVLTQSEPTTIPFRERRSVEMRQPSAGLRERLFQEGFYGKHSTIEFNLCNLELICQLLLPDHMTFKQILPLSDLQFIMRGPLRDDDDYLAITHQYPSYGSKLWYDAEGPSAKWHQSD